MEAPYDLEPDRIISEIRRLRVRRVLLQMPDGLKPYAQQLAGEIAGRTGVEVFLSASPCYGGCDLALTEAERLGVGLLVHFGHTPFVASPRKLKILYVEARCRLGVSEAIRKAIGLLTPHRRIGLTATLQHVHKLNEAKKVLEAEGFRVVVGSPKGKGVAYPGQILGCNVTAASSISAKVEAYLHVGGGFFHALGIYLALGKPVVAADPYKGEALEVSELGERIKRRLKANLMRVGEASKVGVILGVKPGQFNPQQALKVKRSLERLGKQVSLLSLDEVNSQQLENFPELEAYVSTACPRLGLDDGERWVKPLVPAASFLKAFGG